MPSGQHGIARSAKWLEHTRQEGIGRRVEPWQERGAIRDRTAAAHSAEAEWRTFDTDADPARWSLTTGHPRRP